MSVQEISKKMAEILSRIKTRRTELGMSYQDLADKTGLSKSTLQRYETGAIKNMPLDKLEDVAAALYVEPTYLMGWDHSKNQPSIVYTLDKEVVQKAQEIYDDIDTRILLDAKRDLKKEDLDYIVGLVKRLRGSDHT